MNLAWYARRLSRMSPVEIGGRLADAYVKRRWRDRQVRNIAEDALPLPATVPAYESGIERFERALVPADAAARIVTAADSVLGGRFPVFDRLRDDLADTPDWFFDPRTGRHAPQGDYAFDINYRLVENVGTVKYVWEPSRHHHLTVLAAAYFLTQEPRYAEAVDRQLRSWLAQNPFLSGIHWTSGIELGVRLISWVWIRRLLDGWAGARALFEENSVFLRQLHHHQEYLARLPSHGSSANNHLIAEHAGQFAACCAFPFFRESSSWREQAAGSMRREIRRQTFECGLNRELATSYHMFVLELFLAAAVEGAAADHPLDEGVWSGACRMTDALAAILDGDGKPPRQNDGDDAIGLMLDAPDTDRCRSLLATGDALFGRCDWWPEFAGDDLRTMLWRHMAGRPSHRVERPRARPNLFADAGMAILRGDMSDGRELWCRCDHGPHGYLSIAAHGHADALSVELRCGGVEILVDSGTYTYQGEEAWRSYFRSTIGHNCLELGGVDQSLSGGAFMWTRMAKSELLELDGLEKGPVAEWYAQHDGYMRLTPGALHRRRVRLDRAGGALSITDVVVSEGGQTCRLAFHLGPEVRCRLEGCEAHLSWEKDSVWYGAVMQLPPVLAWSAVSGQSEPPLGWYSPVFGEKVPTMTLLGVGVAGRNETMTTEIYF